MPLAERLPKWMQGRPINIIEPGVPLDEIPDGPPCVACEQPTVKALVPYLCGGDNIVVKMMGPGYKCPVDGSEFHNDNLHLSFLSRAYEILKANDDGQAKYIKAEIDLRQKQRQNQG